MKKIFLYSFILLTVACTKGASKTPPDQSSKQVESLTSELKALQASFSQLNKNSSSETNQKVIELETKIKQLEGKLEQCGTENCESLKEQIKQLKDDLEQETKTWSERTTKLEKQVDDLQSQLDQLNELVFEYGAILAQCCSGKTDAETADILGDYEKIKKMLGSIENMITSDPSNSELPRLLQNLKDLTEITKSKILAYQQNTAKSKGSKKQLGEVGAKLDEIISRIGSLQSNPNLKPEASDKVDMLQDKITQLAELLKQLKSAAGIMATGKSGGNGSGGFGGLCLSGSCSGMFSGGMGLGGMSLEEALMTINQLNQSIDDLLKDPEVVAALGSELDAIKKQLEQIRSGLGAEIKNIETQINAQKGKGAKVPPSIQDEINKFKSKNVSSPSPVKTVTGGAQITSPAIQLTDQEQQAAQIQQGQGMAQTNSGDVVAIKDKQQIVDLANQNSINQDAVEDAFTITNHTNGTIYLAKADENISQSIATSILGNIKGKMNDNNATGLELVFFVDWSGSMTENIQNVVQGMSGLSKSLSAITDASRSVKLGVVGFGGDVRLIQNLTTDVTAIETALSGINSGSSTHPGEVSIQGLEKILKEISWSSGSSTEKIILMITDEGSNEMRTQQSYLPILDGLKTKGIRVYAITVPE